MPLNLMVTRPFEDHTGNATLWLFSCRSRQDMGGRGECQSETWDEDKMEQKFTKMENGWGCRFLEMEAGGLVVQSYPRLHSKFNLDT